MVAMRDARLTDVDLQYSAGRQRLVPPDEPLIGIARSMRTCFGNPPQG
jgi:hypothetical protein